MASIKKRRNGSGRLRYMVLHYVRTDAGLAERSIGTFATEKEAKRAKANLELQGTRRDSKGETCESLLRRWLEFKALDAEPTTMDRYMVNAEVWCDLSVDGKRWGDRRVDRTTTEDVNSALRVLGKDRAPQTLRNMRSVMKQAFDLAVAQGWIFANPFAQSLRIPSKPKKAAHWDLEELATLRRTAWKRAEFPGPSAKWPLTDARILEVLIGTGLRREEVLGLRWRDVHLKTGRIKIRQVCVETYVRQGPDSKRQSVGGSLKDVPKTAASARTIPLPPFVVDQIRDQRRATLEMRMAAQGAWNPQDLVFPDPHTGDLMSPHAFTIRMNRLVKQAGVSRAPGSVHGLRHSHGQGLLEHASTPVSTVAQRLGHSSEKTTLTIYLRSTSAMDEAAAEDAEAVFGKKPSRGEGSMQTRVQTLSPSPQENPTNRDT